MTYVERRLHVDAAPTDVWRVMMEIERWPEWTASAEAALRAAYGVAPRYSRRSASMGSRRAARHAG
jgi:hypothetical protein